MASVETSTPEEIPPVETRNVVEEEAPSSLEEEKPPPELKTTSDDASPVDHLALAEVVLRFMLFASALVAVVVIVTSKQTVHSVPAEFNHSPAFIYFLAALSTAGLYSIVTTSLSFYALLKPGCYPKVLSHFVVFDVLLLGVVAAATGAAGAVAYVGLKGNSHVGWKKICDVYGEFCRHVGASVFVSLFASVVLAFLVLLSVYALSKKISK